MESTEQPKPRIGKPLGEFRRAWLRTARIGHPNRPAPRRVLKHHRHPKPH